MPITYDPATNTITVTGYTEGSPCTFTNLLDADHGGTFVLIDRDGITAVDAAPVNNTYNLRPGAVFPDFIDQLRGGGYGTLFLWVENFTESLPNPSVTIRLFGTDEGNNAITEDITFTGNGEFFATKLFRTLTQTQVIAMDKVTSFDYAPTQDHWSVVWQRGPQVEPLQFYFLAAVVIGDGTTPTWFADTAKQITFNDLYYPLPLHFKANSHVQFGVLEDAAKKTTTDGCSFFFRVSGGSPEVRCDPNSDVKFYSSDFAYYSPSVYLYIKDATRFYNCLFKGSVHIRPQDITTDLHGITLSKGRLELQNSAPVTVDTITITDADRAIFVYNYAASTVKNAEFLNCSYTVYETRGGGPVYLINVNSDLWHFFFGRTSDTIYRQYEFDLKVQDKNENAINGATVKIWDKDNNLVVDTTTNASGVITTQTLNYGYYAVATGDTPTMQTPHIILITKPGYAPYKNKFTLDEKMNWRIMLKHSNVCVDQEVMLS